jgi:hypothetical protein
MNFLCSGRPGRPALWALLIAALLPLPLGAQVDIESLRRVDVPTGVSGSLGGDLSVETGNTEKVELSFDARLNWVRGRATTLLIGDGGLGLLSGDRFASSGLAHLRQTFWLHERIAPEWYAQVNYDRPLSLDFRALGGVGGRVQLSRGDWGAVGAGVSLMVEHERIDLPAGARHDDRTNTVRNSTFVTLRLVGGEVLVVSSTAYIQPAVDDLGDVRVLENLRVAASITDRLALTVTFDLRYDSGPPDGIESLDTDLETGLTFTY